jgi:cobalt transporter subunit CbtB
LLLLYLVGADEGAASLVNGNLVHEYMHDGRHLLAFPCH